MQGHRAQTYGEFFAKPGGWWRLVDKTDPNNPYTVWHTCPPCGHHGVLASKAAGDPEEHVVTEHDDGTISVDGSILCRQCGWHGHLDHGIWREV